ncbi:MAG: ribose 5-phosphate isomerase B [Defluviitoga tunisiensis]|jgi:ribose 5-phosphate isomerase B|uniref:Ribose 5-phosphate isomerase RpiB n=1 Tax=Defluviitoga tunisiensis TaxID=1006576 RepID=A0A0C7P490_DEFTU|nr:ribose 5-phosphate isomerase B [Defluviitoga tunisiensis]MDD3600629.1 ribose 5-phosphate isomerase B [Defluviitoga tunisiensis]MDY0379965.1 ribose 5-phosphate isomerase B [Defluviitoga tunisiensis]CEP79150.1 Ribose 5-phosphate isomerase RpiB [Defluviitoga tunisiensis]HHV01829.1 ribose 5-phosphate isomerase B [Defluviitoga tunisiensis]HOB55242.1 ribose 5-phosphate isomerase B [Defluviitoga tunisiensis]
MKIAIASDHAAFEMKEELVNYLKEKNIDVIDLGTYSKESVDYPDYAKMLGEMVANRKVEYGIGLCGTGIGMSISVNKIKGIRGALCLYPSMAELARKHNNANVLVLAGRLMGYDLAKWTVDTFLSTEFEGERHQRRIDKISNIEEQN